MTQGDAGTEVRIFVSSPSDLRSERIHVETVIDQLNEKELSGTGIRLVPMLYENEVPAQVGMPAQALVDLYLGHAADMDVFVCMLWTKVGSEVIIEGMRHESGTVYEFNDAYAGFKRTNRPKVLLYRCVRPRPADSDETEFRKVEAFFDKFQVKYPQFLRLEGLPQTFNDEQEFADLLSRDLQRVAWEIARPGNTEVGRVSSDGRRIESELVKSVRSFLSNFDDAFRSGREKTPTRATTSIPTKLRALPDLAAPDGPVTGAVLPEAGTSLLDLYERWGRRVLILGQAGMGKTFTMLQLMEELINRSERTGTGLIPVYFDVSSWAATHSLTREGRGLFDRALALLRPRSLKKNPTLDDWLVDELVRWYGISRKAALHLVRDRQIVICLDGLDELSMEEGAAIEGGQPTGAELRAACVRTINRTIDRDHSLQMILCCRDQTFDELPEKPRLGAPLQMERLDREDIADYLARWPNLDGLQEAIAESPVLDDKARTPLFLWMMSLSYAGMARKAIVDASKQPPDQWERHLLDNFVNRCLSVVPPSSASYTKDDIPGYLTWIARRREADFLIEDLQPGALLSKSDQADPGWYRLYQRLSVGALTVVLTLMVCVPSIVGLGLEWLETGSRWEGLKHTFLIALTSVSLTFAFGWVAFAAKRWWVFGVVLGIAFGIVRGTNTALSAPTFVGGTQKAGVTTALVSIPCAMVVFLLFGYQTLGRIAQYKQKYRNRPDIEWFEILPLESLGWRWYDRETYLRGGWLGLVIGPLIGMLFSRELGIAQGVPFGLLATINVTIFSGLSGTGIRVSLKPNQGISRSLRHALLMAALFTISGAIGFGVSYGVAYGKLMGIVNLILGCALSFIFLIFGGMPVIRHICLGHVLYLQKKLPPWFCWPPWRNTVAFLDDMVRYRLLRRSAGGYKFRHEVVRQYYRRLGD